MGNFLKSNRFDNIALTLGKNVHETPQGFLRIPAYTARTGIQKYRMDDGSILKEYRPEEEVFSKSSMDSLATAAVTNSHPSEMVNPDNAKELMVGFPIGGVKKVDDDGLEKFLTTDVVVTHRTAIDAIRNGKAQLSNGYHVDLDFEPGEYNGEKYDAVQRNIVNNHIAIVWRARGGEKVRLRLDSNDGILINDNEDEGVKTMKLTIGDKEFEVEDAAGEAIKAEMDSMSKKIEDACKKHDSVETELKDVKEEKTTLTAKVDSLESDLAKAKEVKPEMPAEKFDAAVKERISVLDSGRKMLDAEAVKKLDEMSNSEIKIAIIKVDSENVDEEKLKNEAYVDARYDHICEGFEKADAAKKDLGNKIVEGRENADSDSNDDYVSPEQKRLDNMKKAKEDSLKPVNK